MMTHATAFELSRQRLELAQQRATLMGMLGSLPKPQATFPFRRQRAMPLAGPVDVRHYLPETGRRLSHLPELVTSERRAS
ncbi:MAG: hypothetical protein IPF51_08505 [Dehalococcoidia bacterium]|uniref:hypothetical protein n=1 Tax=Candidatus Amarobacter glycogenicus TaxID=3140699 RepID=UPI003134A183|nr:hypothetical protein [Dehalococcoidia bacterium]